jgi:hypothetical protein
MLKLAEELGFEVDVREKTEGGTKKIVLALT